MGRRKKTTSELIKDVNKKYKFLTADRGNCLFCTYCSDQINFTHSHIWSRVQNHIETNYRRANERKAKLSGVSQITLTQSLARSSESETKRAKFGSDLALALVGSDIPIFKIESEDFRAFLTKYTGQSLPSMNTLRYKHVGQLFEESLSAIRAIVGDQEICFMIDETTDCCERFQVNVLVSVLNGSPSRPMLLHTEFTATCDGPAILRIFIKCCHLLWRSDDPPYERVLLLVSDQAKYMINAGRLIKGLAPRMMHITCLAHCLNRVAERVRDQHEYVDVFVAKLKETMRGSHSRKLQYTQITGLPLPPKPVLTRWTTWLQAARYASQNVSKIRLFIFSLSSESNTLRARKRLVDDDQLSEQLMSVTDFFFLIDSTTKLEERNMRSADAIAVIDQSIELLAQAGDTAASHKIVSSLSKNPDYANFKGERDLAFKIKMKFAPLVSVEVERSFSVTKKILAKDRCSFTEDNLRMHYLIRFNSFLRQNVISLE